MFRRRRSIRTYVKVAIAVILVLFFISIVQFAGQIESPSDGKRGGRVHHQMGVEKSPLDQKNNLWEKAVDRFQLHRNDIRPLGKDLDADESEFKRTMTSLQRLVHLDLKVSLSFFTSE